MAAMAPPSKAPPGLFSPFARTVSLVSVRAGNVPPMSRMPSKPPVLFIITIFFTFCSHIVQGGVQTKRISADCSEEAEENQS